MKQQNKTSKNPVMLISGAAVIVVNLVSFTVFVRQFIPSGLYANVYGKELYMGDFVEDPDPQCPIACSLAVRTNGKLAMMLAAQRRGTLK